MPLKGNLVPRVLSYPTYGASERETLENAGRGGVLCLTFFCLVYSQRSRSDHNSKIDLLTILQLKLKLREISA